MNQPTAKPLDLNHQTPGRKHPNPWSQTPTPWQKFENGVLTVVIKKRAESQPREIEIQ